MRRLYVSNLDKLKPHHHIRITQENRMDLQVWQQFLNIPEVFCRPFMDPTLLSAFEIDMYSDASRNFELGFGAYCEKQWTIGQWDKSFMEKYET